MGYLAILLRETPWMVPLLILALNLVFLAVTRLLGAWSPHAIPKWILVGMVVFTLLPIVAFFCPTSGLAGKLGIVEIHQSSHEPNRPNIIGRDNQITINSDTPPRRLEGDNRQRLIQELRKSSGNAVAISSALNDSEASQLASDLLSAFKEAGWSPDGRAIGAAVLTPPFVGVRVLVRDAGHYADRDPLVRVVRSLQAAGMGPQYGSDRSRPDNTPIVEVGPRR